MKRELTKFSKKVLPRDRKDSDRKGQEWYSDRIKLKAVKLWLQSGSLPYVAKTLNVPYNTVRAWKYYSDWWEVFVREQTNENNQKKDATLETLITASYNVLQNRLDNGDIILDSRTGELINVPLKGKDVATISRTLHQQQKDIREAPVQAAARQATNEMLIDLAKQFAQIAKGNKRDTKEIIDGEAVEIVEETDKVDE